MLDGIIVINKQKGYTSHDVVNIVKKILKEKVGHIGTLDPNATGVLPLLIGKGTKLSQFLIEHDKEYVVVLQLGIKTDTADGDGNIIERHDVRKTILTKENVSSVLTSFIGKQNQIPPMYSAIKVNGKKLYEYARKNEQVELTPRQIEIYEINLLELNKEENQIMFNVKCSKGTYIRSLCEDIALKLGTVGFMKELQRTVVGDFNLSNSIKVEDLDNNINNEKWICEHFISIEKFFQKYNNDISLNEKELRLFLNGIGLKYNLKDGLYRIYVQDRFIGIGLIQNNLLKREIIVEKENKI